ncbi:MAG: MFS transporter [Aestuariivirga sp.]|uniref:MFS transporter n=1 Tax=Aestuariivirga sp. TaxID=2650926 RepID=UPI0025B92263|nr:MFS transporter [Aestuariivirga sp.]MCA3560548.1 MFS transporter [Aestuariivirga sp.]
MPLPLRMALLSAIGLLEAMVFGLSHPIYALNLQQMGMSDSLIGLNATLGGLGVFLIGPFVPWLIARAGYRNYTVLCFAMAALAIGALATGPGFVGWCLSRLVLGVALGSLWILTEAWLNAIVPDDARGRANATFQFCYSIGFMTGPGLVIALGFAGPLPIGVMVLMALAGGIATLFLPQPQASAEAGRLDLGVARKALPLISVAFVTGLVETALYTMLPIFGQKAGFGEKGALSLLIALSLGAISLALPLGLASDRFDRPRLLRLVSTGAFASMLLLLAGTRSHATALAACFVAGGAIIGMYSVSLVILGARYAQGALASVAACYSMAYALGSTFGGVMGGASVEAAGAAGLPLLGVAAIGLHALGVLHRRREEATS